MLKDTEQYRKSSHMGTIKVTLIVNTLQSFFSGQNVQEINNWNLYHIVTDVTSPIANCPAKQIVNANQHGNTKAVVIWSLPSCTDNSRTDVNLECTHQPGDDFFLGETPVQCNCTDKSGNTGQCTFGIIVQGIYIQVKAQGKGLFQPIIV